MDEYELQNITEKITGRCVNAHTIAKDELIHLPVFKKPAIINCNTEDSTGPGEHWLWFFVYNIKNKTVAEYYDSYNESCQFYDIKFPYNIIKSNTKQHQHDNSDLCGKYCIFLTFQRMHNTPYNAIINYFDKNHHENDNKVRSFYNNLHSRLNLPKEATDQTNFSPSCLQMCQVIKKYQKK